MTEPGTERQRYPDGYDQAADNRQNRLESTKERDRPAIGTSPAQDRYGTLMVCAPTEAGEHGDAEEQHEQRPDRHGQPIAGDAGATGDRTQLILGSGDVQLGQRRVVGEGAHALEQGADVGAPQRIGDHRRLPRIGSPEQFQRRKGRSVGNPIGQHDLFGTVWTKLTAQHQITRGDRSAHDRQPERRVVGELRDRLRRRRIGDDSHDLTPLRIAASRPGARRQPSDLLEAIDPGETKDTTIAGCQGAVLHGAQ